MANSKKRKVKGFQFQPFSEKQKKILNWWHKDSPVKDKFMVIADGSIRGGKTICMALSFVMFVMNNFNVMKSCIEAGGKPVMTISLKYAINRLNLIFEIDNNLIVRLSLKK